MRALMLQVRDATAGLLDGIRLSDKLDPVPAAEGLEPVGDEPSSDGPAEGLDIG